MKYALLFKFAMIGMFAAISGTALALPLYPFAVGDGGIGAKNTNVCVCNGATGCNAGGHWFTNGTHFGMNISDTVAKAATAAGANSVWYCYKPTSEPLAIGTRGSDKTIQTACTCVGMRKDGPYCGAAKPEQSRQIKGGAKNNYKQGLTFSVAGSSYSGTDASGTSSATGWLCGPHLGESAAFEGKSRNFDNSIAPAAK